jgi:hypothetical protein
MIRRLSGYEKETIVTFNEAEDAAQIFTYNSKWQKHLEHKLRLKPLMDNGFGGKEYEVSKKRIRPPIARRPLSPEVKARKAKQLIEARQNRNIKAETLIPINNSVAKQRSTGKKLLLELTGEQTSCSMIMRRDAYIRKR